MNWDQAIRIIAKETVIKEREQGTTYEDALERTKTAFRLYLRWKRQGKTVPEMLKAIDDMLSLDKE